MKEEYFKKKLTKEQYHILRERGTEAPGTGKLLYNKKTGMYICAACGNQIFSSKHKFDSGTGWPSFYEAIKEGSVTLRKDIGLGMERTEVLCAKCGSHLGHMFEEQKTVTCPTGKRFCINSAALDFKEEKKKRIQ